MQSLFIYSAFGICINLNFEKFTLKTGFVVQGHKYGISHSVLEVALTQMFRNLQNILSSDGKIRWPSITLTDYTEGDLL